MGQNTELLILTVKNNPILYNTSHVDYKNIGTKNKVWETIAKKTGEEDSDTLKMKWKNLRDAYIKHLRSSNTKTGKATKLVERYKSWPWAQQMSFLRPHLESEDTKLTLRIDRKITKSKSQESAPFKHVYIRKRTVAHIESQVDKVINILNQRKDEYDDTELLFLAYAKKLKKMTTRRQAKVKLEIAKIMMSAEIEESDEFESAVDTRFMQGSENMETQLSHICSSDADTKIAISPT